MNSIEFLVALSAVIAVNALFISSFASLSNELALAANSSQARFAFASNCLAFELLHSSSDIDAIALPSFNYSACSLHGGES